MPLRLVTSPWQVQFERLLSSAKTELRIAAPFYTDEVIRGILNRVSKKVAKFFILALSEEAVMTGTQSTTAIMLIRKDPRCMARFIENLHAKIIIVDRKTAIVTSSNLTRAGLGSNVEIGVAIDDPKTIDELMRYFDGLWSKAAGISTSALGEYEKMRSPSQGGKAGKRYGPRITFARLPKQPPAIGGVTPGWILIHSSKVYGVGKDYSTPQEELAELYDPKQPLNWHWTLPKPLKEGGPYKLLLAWDKKVFGEALATITRDIDSEMRPRYRFAFVLRDYTLLKREIPFDELPLGGRARWHRSLIRLDEKIIAAVSRLR